MNLDGIAAVVTGGASGLGEASARTLADAGAIVIVADVDRERGAEVADSIGGVFVPTDVSAGHDVATAIERAASQGLPLRVAVSCAGVGAVERTVARDGSAHNSASFERVLSVNLVGTFHLLRLAAAAIARTEPVDEDGSRGVIVTTASVAAIEGQVGQVAYAASKGGVTAMTLPAARDLAVHGIRVCSIIPGTMDTPLFARAKSQVAEQLGRSVIFPRRTGRPDEFGALVRAIAEIDYLNAEVIRLDGGIRMSAK